MLVAMLFLLIVHHLAEAQIPPSPCPQTFNYFESPALGIFGAVTFANDLSGVYDLQINMSVPVNTKDNIEIKRQTSDFEVQSGGPLKYFVTFPKNQVPKLVSVTFNNQLYCYGPPSEGPVITTLSRRNVLRTGGPAQGFNSQNFQQNFEQKPQNVDQNLDKKSENYATKPQNFYQKPQNFDQNLQSFAKPQNFDAKPQNFDTKPQNFDTKPQNFDTKPQNFYQKPQNFEQNFIPQSQNNFENPQQPLNSFQSQFNPPITTSLTTPTARIPPTTKRRPTEPPSLTNQRQETKPVIQSHINVQHDGQECGMNSDYQPLVFAGTATRTGEYPWLVAMFYLSNRAYNFRCAGSLVSTRHVVTAAHCIRIIGRPDINREDVLIVMGKHNLKYWATKSTIKGVLDFLVHPEFKGPGDADIAVIILDSEIRYSATVRPLCLWEETDQLDNIVGTSGVVAGWGRDETGRDFVDEPAQISIPIVSQETCLRSDDRFLKLTSGRTFCAGSRNGSIPCTGDSGGGFFMKRNGRWILRGVVSVALVDPNTRSCDASHYVVFSDVPKYKPWLTKAMRGT